MWRILALLALAAVPASAQFGSNATTLRGKRICSPMAALSDGYTLSWDAAHGCFKVAAGGGGGGGATCTTGTVSYTALTANATSQEISIMTSVSAKFRYYHVLIQEATQFAGTPSLTVSMGTTGVDTDLLLPMTLKQASAPQNYGHDNPRPPVIGTGTYNLVLQFVGSAAIGNGTATNFSAGAINWEVCGYSVP